MYAVSVFVLWFVGSRFLQLLFFLLHRLINNAIFNKFSHISIVKMVIDFIIACFVLNFLVSTVKLQYLSQRLLEKETAK